MAAVYVDCPECGQEGVEVSGSYRAPIPGTFLQPPEGATFDDVRGSCGCDLGGNEWVLLCLLEEECA